MRGFRKILIFILLLVTIVLGKNAYAQQDPLYTQYMDNLLVINPAFAGSKNVGEVLFVARNQWVSFEGAPETRSFSYNTPSLENKVGVGFSVMYDKIGPQSRIGVYFDYSYFLQVSEKFRLGMGLKGGLNFYRASLTDLVTISPDPIFQDDIYRNFLPNVGVGLYLFSDDAYLGLSVPKLIENTITRDDYETVYVNKEEMHLYLVGGKQFPLGSEIQLKTSAMLQYVKDAPFTFQASALLGFKEKFWVGAMARIGDAFGAVMQFQATKKMVIGYSYDLTISEISSFSNGTHEIMFSYDIDFLGRSRAAKIEQEQAK